MRAEGKAVLKAWNRLLDRFAYWRAPNPYPVTIAGTTVRYPIPTLWTWAYVHQLNERDLIAWLCYDLADDDVVWDIGAHIGLWTFPMAGQVTDGTVVAVEPGPRNQAILRKTAAMNDCENLTIQADALSNRAGKASIALPADTSMNHLVTDDTDGKSVQTVRGDDLVADNTCPAPSVVKMDIEGGECDALRGMGTVLNGCRLVVYEVHHAHGVATESVTDALEAHGLTCQTLTTGERTSHVVGRR